MTQAVQIYNAKKSFYIILQLRLNIHQATAEVRKIAKDCPPYNVMILTTIVILVGVG